MTEPPTTTSPTSVVKDGEYYKRKYSRLLKMVVEIVHQNGALCQELARTEDKILTAKAERKYLVKKLMQYEKPNLTSLKSTKKSDGKSKKKSNSKNNSKSTGESSSSTQKLKSIFVKPINVDNSGRPIFPIEIDDLSVYSIGEIVHDRSNYHNTKFIFPVGFCSTRLFSSISSPDQQCLYTCKIFDDGLCPKFEISPEDNPEMTFSSSSISEVYASFLLAVSSQNTEHLTLSEYDFFGLSYPVIQNLIQSLPGAYECTSYEWKKIEVIRPQKRKPASDPAQASDSGSTKTGKIARQSDINIEALERWARDT